MVCSQLALAPLTNPRVPKTAMMWRGQGQGCCGAVGQVGSSFLPRPLRRRVRRSRRCSAALLHSLAGVTQTAGLKGQAAIYRGPGPDGRAWREEGHLQPPGGNPQTGKAIFKLGISPKPSGPRPLGGKEKYMTVYPKMSSLGERPDIRRAQAPGYCLDGETEAQGERNILLPSVIAGVKATQGSEETTNRELKSTQAAGN